MDNRVFVKLLNKLNKDLSKLSKDIKRSLEYDVDPKSLIDDVFDKIADFIDKTEDM